MDGISIMTVTPVLASSCVENISHQSKRGIDSRKLVSKFIEGIRIK